MAKILYIEDDHALADCVVEILEDAGHVVTWFDNRDQAHRDVRGMVQIMSANDERFYGICISDYNVPAGHFSDTQELCAEHELPVLLLSGESWNKQRPCPHKFFLEKIDMAEKLLLIVEKMVNEEGSDAPKN